MTVDSEDTSYRLKKDSVPTPLLNIQSPKYEAKQPVKIGKTSQCGETYEAILYPSIDIQDGGSLQTKKRSPFLAKAPGIK